MTVTIINQQMGSNGSNHRSDRSLGPGPFLQKQATYYTLGKSICRPFQQPVWPKPRQAGTGNRHLIVINSLPKERQQQQGENTKERDASPFSWAGEQEAEISSDLKEQAAASQSTSGSPSVKGKRFLGREKVSWPGKAT